MITDVNIINNAEHSKSGKNNFCVDTTLQKIYVRHIHYTTPESRI
jgi:hypothetical protein